MSRVIVKQLPKNINEEKLRNLFGSKGTITDLQLKYTADGKFRQFCFIGYHTEEEADQAVKFFDNTFIQTNRIKVQKCANLGSEEKPQSWSKYAKDSKKNLISEETQVDSTKEKKFKKVDKVTEILEKHKDDPKFQEFLQVHDRNRDLWGNDVLAAQNENKKKTNDADDDENDAGKDSGVTEDEENEDEEEEDSEEKLAEKPISDLDYMKSLMTQNNKAIEKQDTNTKKNKATNIDLFTLKIHNLPYKTRRPDVLKFFKPLKPYSVRLPTNVSGFCYVGFKTEKDMQKAMLKNKSFIKGKQVFFSDFTEKNKITKSKKNLNQTTDNVENTEKPQEENAKWTKQKDNLKNEEDISESGRIFFRNLAYTVTEEDLQKVFEQFGPVAEINLPVDKVTRQIKGFGTVTYVMPEHAVLAFNKLDGTDFHGRLLHLIPGKSRDNDDTNLNDENAEGLSFKQKKALKLKNSAQQAATWNTLFLGVNAVADILSKKYNMSKEQILDTETGGSSAAVRMALGETQIIMEMRQFLEDEGVHLSAFDTPNAKRSKTILLAKNLPADTKSTELTPLFAKFGPIGRLVLPPSGVTALVEYYEPSEARQAFKKLAYSKFKNVPLFLEWAPENTFKKTLSGEPIAVKLETIEEAKKEEKQQQEEVNVIEKEAEEDDLADAEPEENTTLFLRNLNFQTVMETIKQHFKQLGPIHTVEIAKKKDAQNAGQWSSLGYGFIQFKKAETAARALKEMQFTSIDGYQVELKRSDRILKSSLNTQRKQVALTKQTGTKILVRNIPFQAKVREVRELFQTFGELRSVRLPMKMTPGENSHRGFGFVDFLSKADAARAFDGLGHSTHLYGRRLVLEWASTDDEDIDALRKRTASHFGAATAASTQKRSKKAVFNTDDIDNVETNADEES